MVCVVVVVCCRHTRKQARKRTLAGTHAHKRTEEEGEVLVAESAHGGSNRRLFPAVQRFRRLHVDLHHEFLHQARHVVQEVLRVPVLCGETGGDEGDGDGDGDGADNSGRDVLLFLLFGAGAAVVAVGVVVVVLGLVVDVNDVA